MDGPLYSLKLITIFLTHCISVSISFIVLSAFLVSKGETLIFLITSSTPVFLLRASLTSPYYPCPKFLIISKSSLMMFLCFAQLPLLICVPARKSFLPKIFCGDLPDDCSAWVISSSLRRLIFWPRYFLKKIRSSSCFDAGSQHFYKFMPMLNSF